jgi:hypothetical protein
MTTFVDALPPTARNALLGGTGVALGVATAWLGRSGWPTWLEHLVVVALAAVILATWREAWRRAPAAELAGGDHRLRGVHSGAVAPSRTASWNDRLAAIDPAFSVPVLHRALRALANEPDGGPPAVLSCDFPPGELVVSAVLPGRPNSVRLRVSRPLGVPLSPPEHAEHGWRLLSKEFVPGTVPVVRPEVDPGMPAARRALLLRDPSFSLDDFASYLRQLRAELAAGERREHLDPQAVADLAFYGVPGPAAGDLPVRWLEVELDGWFERIEVEHAGWWVSLLRTTGDPGAAWRVWRLVPVRGDQ